MEGRVSKVDGSALIEDLVRKVKMRRKQACIYKDKGTEDEGTLWFE